MSDTVDEQDAVAEPAASLQRFQHVDGNARIVDLVCVHLKRPTYKLNVLKHNYFRSMPNRDNCIVYRGVHLISLLIYFNCLFMIVLTLFIYFDCTFTLYTLIAHLL